MRATKHTNLRPANLTVIVAIVGLACCAGFSTNANASCGGFKGEPSAMTVPATPQVQNHESMSLPSSRDGKPGENVSIVGLWAVTFNSKGQVFDQGYDQWHSGGTEILNDIAPPEPANGSGAFCLGVYKKTGPRSFKLVHPAFAFDANGNLAAHILLLENVTVDRNGKSYRGTFSFLQYDLSGNLIFQADGDLLAERITAD